jgi:tetratricopeptide (TPR) repeat protein
MKIVVYAISKNEAKFAKRFCDAAREADLIFVADTGSTDHTVTLLEDCGATVVHISIKPWRFDDARNAALAMLPADFDVCVSLDLDEVLQPGWRAEIERVWMEDTTRLRYGFDWGAGIVFKYEKIHARHGYRWHHPCHEYPVPDRITEKWADTDMLMVIHKPDPEKSRGQYLDLLKISIEEDPNCPRNAFYYARELSFHSRWAEAIEQCKRYLALPRAVWANERCYAMRVIGRASKELGNYGEALNWFRRACSEAPDTREPWFELALCCYQMERWAECFGAAMTCLSITHREFLYTVDPSVWGANPHDLAAISAWNMGLKDVAIEQGRKAVELAPDDFRMRQNLEWFEGKRTAEDAA